MLLNTRKTGKKLTYFLGGLLTGEKNIHYCLENGKVTFAQPLRVSKVEIFVLSAYE